MKSFPMLQYLKGKDDVLAFSLLLDSQQGSLQIQPETDLL